MTQSHAISHIQTLFYLPTRTGTLDLAHVICADGASQAAGEDASHASEAMIRAAAARAVQSHDLKVTLVRY